MSITETQIEELRDEINKMKYDLKTFPLGQTSVRVLENEIEHREILIDKLKALFG